MSAATESRYVPSLRTSRPVSSIWGSSSSVRDLEYQQSQQSAPGQWLKRMFSRILKPTNSRVSLRKLIEIPEKTPDVKTWSATSQLGAAPQRRLPDVPSTMFFCIDCLQELPLTSFPPQARASASSEEPKTCTPCIRTRMPGNNNAGLEGPIASSQTSATVDPLESINTSNLPILEEEHVLEIPQLITRSCVTCSTVLPEASFPTRPPTSACTHEPNTCTSCLGHRLQSNIRDSSMTISCPTCSLPLEYDDVRRCVSPKDLEAYDILLLRQQLRSCAICSQDLPIGNFPAQPPTSACTHGPNTCNSCVNQRIRLGIREGNVASLCPWCQSALQREDVRRWVTREDFERYDMLLFGQHITRPCVVCGADLPVTVCFPAQTPTTWCTHPPNACTSCLGELLRSTIADDNTTIRCPTCSSDLGYDDIRRYASPEDFEKYNALFSRQQVLRTCTVCNWVLPAVNFPEQAPTSACTHEPNACNACLRQHARSGISISTTAIACPTCSASLEYHDVRRCVPREDFEKYDALLLRQQLTRSCVVCRRTLVLTNFPLRAPTSTCSHEPNACTSCLDQRVHSCVTGNNSSMLCPTCCATLEYHDVQRSVSREVFEEYDTLLLRQQLMRPCVIFCQELAVVNFPLKAPTSACEHEPDVCQSCLGLRVQSSIKDRNLSISCPTCPVSLEYQDVQRCVSKEDFDRYDFLLVERYLPRCCIRCLSELPRDDFPDQAPASGCEHEPDVCRSCVRQHVRSTIGDNNLSIPCPTCSVVLEYYDVKRWVNREDFDEYDTMLLNQNITRHCAVCCDELPVTYFPAQSPTPICTHEPAACSSCLAAHVRTRIRKNKTAIPCPTCSELLKEDDVRRCISGNDLDNYDALLLRRKLPRSCIICLEELPPTDFPPQTPTTACNHEANVCTSCLSQTVQTSVDDSNTSISCPTCSEPMDYCDVQQCLNDEHFAKYDALLLRQQLSGAKEFFWCLNAGCGAGQLHDPQDGEVIVICASCGSMACFVHAMPWHTGLTCTQYDEQQKQNERDIADQAYIRSHTKACPSCRAAIEKTQGCDHMTCRPPGGCGHQFCWLCLADWGPILANGNHYHQTECSYYRPFKG